MIKRIRFVTRAHGADADEFADRWAAPVVELAAAPEGTRQSRATLCTVIPELTDPHAPHDAISLEWFADVDHLARAGAWAAARSPSADGVVDAASGRVMLADEVVLRGADRLERRWREGGARFKHMAAAVRAEGLTRADFSTRWRAHQGRVGASAATVIPDEVRGLAYVQNHPLDVAEAANGDGGYDALNEVWFEDRGALAARVEWFAEHPPGDDGLFGRTWLYAACEEVLV